MSADSVHSGGRATGGKTACGVAPRSPPIALPALKTLDHKPSWVNRAGRIDRSACAELRAADIWREVPKSEWRRTPSPSAGGDHPTSTGRPRERVGVRVRARARKTKSHREAHAVFTIDAQGLAQLHDTRPPRQLAGDFRTRKSNAMRSHVVLDHVSFAANPNRGATRLKKLGLWFGRDHFYAKSSSATREAWSQTIRIERWRLHERLAQHFLICPHCKKKSLKLFLVLAREDEVYDAQLAEGWINMFDALRSTPGAPGSLRTDRQLTELRARLIDRYGLLFHGGGGRRLVCRKCLNIRYGEVKWQRQAESDQLRAERHRAARAAHDAERAAQHRAQHARDIETIKQAFPPQALEAERRALQAARLQRARKDRENECRRIRRRRQAAEATRQVR